VVRGLNEPDANRSTIALASQTSLHERPADAAILRRGVHRHRADSGDHRAFVDEHASEQLAVALGNETGKSLCRQHVRDLEARELAGDRLDRKVVPRGDRLERVVEDASAGVGVVGGHLPEGDAGLVRLHRLRS
jgi:hypothetical protein